MPDRALLAERVWYGTGVVDRLARVALRPAEWLFGAAVSLRGRLYDRGTLRTHATALPCVSVGNLSVGGTGKTPVAAYIASELQRRGAHPALVLRGYGGDEPLVHATINPSVPVVIAADRVDGVARAKVMGADCAVLDDAFQHRRAARVVDIVLVSAERWPITRHLLPAGPLREPVSALRRATMVLVTRKTATAGAARELAVALSSETGITAGVAALLPGALVGLSGNESLPLGALAGKRVLAISAIADPAAFEGQLAALGAEVEGARFGDHHQFRENDVLPVALRAARADLAVCTLKDAVKLAPMWPRAGATLLYVSQRVDIELGADVLAEHLRLLLMARPAATPAAGERRRF